MFDINIGRNKMKDFTIQEWKQIIEEIENQLSGATGERFEELMADLKEAEDMLFLEEYKENQKKRTPEELAEERFEMEAAFGKGTTVVNIITGERTKL
jgi:hypothetical protein|tara:strand:+ start:138 stop:431 length:294 start_codon:yes stop_codon:yes gene_type:complete